MSTATLTEAQAEQQVQAEVVGPVFFSKLAAAGITHRNQEEASKLFGMGQMLLQAHALEQEKQAAAAGDFISRAHAKVAHALGHVAPQQDSVSDADVTHTVNELLKRSPNLLKAASVFNAAVNG